MPSIAAVTLPGPLVDATWLARHAGEVAIADCRWYLDGRSGREAHRAGHIPGAVWLDIDTDLAGPPSPAGGRHPLPAPERFAAALGVAGIGDDTPVVAYDDAGGSIAARLWWMLDALGHPAAVLDGGIGAWTGPLATGDGSRAPAHPTPREWPAGAVLTDAQVHPATRERDLVLLDARVAARYRGEDTSVDPRPGHIPGAVSAPWPDNLGPDGRMLAPERLRRRLGSLGADGSRPVGASCGSGVTACHDLLAMAVAGLPPGRLYVGSWSAWSADPQNPVATGGAPG